MFERFTDRARRVVVLAQEEARMLNHNYIGTEHILLGLIHEGEGVAAKALESLGISLEGVREQVEQIIGQGQTAPAGHIPTLSRAYTNRPLNPNGELPLYGKIPKLAVPPLAVLTSPTLTLRSG